MPTFSPAWYLALLLALRQIKELINAATKSGRITIKVLTMFISISRIMPDFFFFLEGRFGFIFLISLDFLIFKLRERNHNKKI